MGELIGGLLKAECLACKATATKPTMMVRGVLDLEGLALTHEEWCPFWRAMGSSRATTDAWIKANGYPMRYWLDDKPVAVAHPNGRGGWSISDGKKPDA